MLAAYALFVTSTLPASVRCASLIFKFRWATPFLRAVTVYFCFAGPCRHPMR